MSLAERIGYDSGATNLEDSLEFAVAHGIPYLDFGADGGPNRLDNWSDPRVQAVREICQSNGISLSLHTSSGTSPPSTTIPAALVSTPGLPSLAARNAFVAFGL